MTIGVFGGSFDPIHKGHTTLASFIAECGLCDKVLLMVSPLNPLKSENPPTDFRDRYNMALLATEKIDGVTASDFESTLPLPSYTYKTLKYLTEAYPTDNFRLIIGADNWVNFDRWKNPSEIIARFKPIIYPRPGISIVETGLPEGIDFLKKAPLIDISSTELRKALSAPEYTHSERILSLIDPKVAVYARKRHLYD